MKNKPDIIIVGHVGSGVTTAVEALSHVGLNMTVVIVDDLKEQREKEEVKPMRNIKEFVIEARPNYIDIIHDINDTRPFYAKLGKGKKRRY